ncbi:MAG: hypothetical protein LBK54_10270 [Propionibacteriaceae bacterium]|jgi:hypothetical protein|nr:hypothetical protein [Propionibacteriaceae bacterium]
MTIPVPPDPVLPVNTNIPGGDIAQALDQAWQAEKPWIMSVAQSLVPEPGFVGDLNDPPALLYQLFPKDGVWHDSDRNVQLQLTPGVWLITAVGYGRCDGNSAYTAQLALWDNGLASTVAYGPRVYAHAGERASGADLACTLFCPTRITQAGPYRARLSAKVDAASQTNITFVSMSFNALKLW